MYRLNGHILFWKGMSPTNGGKHEFSIDILIAGVLPALNGDTLDLNILYTVNMAKQGHFQTPETAKKEGT